MDLTVHRIVVDELAAIGGDRVATVTQTWSDGGGMWFTEVEPNVPNAAPLSVAYQDETTLNLNIGNLWVEIFGKVEGNVPYLREIVAAVFAGQVEEAGSPSSAFGRLQTASGTVHVGAMHLPLPWRWRQVRRYSPYCG